MVRPCCSPGAAPGLGKQLQTNCWKCHSTFFSALLCSFTLNVVASKIRDWRFLGDFLQAEIFLRFFFESFSSWHQMKFVTIFCWSHWCFSWKSLFFFYSPASWPHFLSRGASIQPGNCWDWEGSYLGLFWPFLVEFQLSQLFHHNIIFFLPRCTNLSILNENIIKAMSVQGKTQSTQGFYLHSSLHGKNQVLLMEYLGVASLCSSLFMDRLHCSATAWKQNWTPQSGKRIPAPLLGAGVVQSHQKHSNSLNCFSSPPRNSSSTAQNLQRTLLGELNLSFWSNLLIYQPLAIAIWEFWSPEVLCSLLWGWEGPRIPPWSPQTSSILGLWGQSSVCVQQDGSNPATEPWNHRIIR